MDSHSDKAPITTSDDEQLRQRGDKWPVVSRVVGHVVMRKKRTPKRKGNEGREKKTKSIPFLPMVYLQSPRSRTPKKRTKPTRKMKCEKKKRLISKCVCHQDRTRRIQEEK